jgi:signal transduction histidine kinase
VQIGRVLYNLIENAARYSPEQSEIVLKIDIDSEGKIPTMARISLLDEGRGIPQYEHERIFKAFYGLHSHGSGLGLAICKGIIEAHQGRIWVENAEKGSCFIFTLPVEASLTR